MYICTPEGLDPMGLWLYMGAGNWTQALWKSTQYFYPSAEPSLQPFNLLFLTIPGPPAEGWPHPPTID